MKNNTNKPLTQGEFEEWAKANKETLNGVEETLNGVEGKITGVEEKITASENRITQKLDGIAKQLTDIQAEGASNIAAHRRFNHRDEVFAEKLSLNLSKIDAEG